MGQFWHACEAGGLLTTISLGMPQCTPKHATQMRRICHKKCNAI